MTHAPFHQIVDAALDYAKCYKAMLDAKNNYQIAKGDAERAIECLEEIQKNAPKAKNNKKVTQYMDGMEVSDSNVKRAIAAQNATKAAAEFASDALSKPMDTYQKAHNGIANELFTEAFNLISNLSTPYLFLAKFKCVFAHMLFLSMQERGLIEKDAELDELMHVKHRTAYDYGKLRVAELIDYVFIFYEKDVEQTYLRLPDNKGFDAVMGLIESIESKAGVKAIDKPNSFIDANNTFYIEINNDVCKCIDRANNLGSLTILAELLDNSNINILANKDADVNR